MNATNDCTDTAYALIELWQGHLDALKARQELLKNVPDLLNGSFMDGFYCIGTSYIGTEHYNKHFTGDPAPVYTVLSGDDFDLLWEEHESDDVVDCHEIRVQPNGELMWLAWGKYDGSEHFTATIKIDELQELYDA